MYVNQIANPFTDLVVGDVLKIPRLNSINLALLGERL